jgi:hypothetical protein
MKRRKPSYRRKSSISASNSRQLSRLSQTSPCILVDLKQMRKATPNHVAIGELSEEQRFSRLLPERKHFLGTIRLISHRAESGMASRPDR